MKKLAFILMVLFALASPVYMLPLLPTLALLVVWGIAILRQPCLPHTAALILALNYLYWGARLLSSGIPWETLASYDFIRWQLRIFIGFLPFFVFATPHLFAHGSSSRQLAFVFVGASTAVVLAGAVQFVFGMASTPAVGEHEAFRGMPIRELFGESWFLGLHRSHAASGGFYLLPTLVALSLFLFWRTTPHPQLLTFGLFAVSLWGLMFTKTRAAYLAFACAFIMALVVYGIERVKGQGPPASHPLLTGLAVGLVTILVPLAVPGGLARMGSVQPHAESLAGETASDRLLYWSAARQMFQESPLVGIGLGRFPTAFAASAFGSQIRVLSPQADMYHAHNSYLQILAELGLVGLSLLVLFWALALKALYGMLSHLHPGSFERAFILGVILGALAQFVVGFFDYNWGAPSIMLPLMFLMGLALAAGQGTAGEMA